MLAKRIIPCLDVKDGRVVKGVNFVDLIDAGDPVAQAQVYDRAGADEFVVVNAALMLFYSFGAIGGPFAASLTMQQFGPSALFVFLACVYVIFIAIILYRMRARSGAHPGRCRHRTRLR